MKKVISIILSLVLCFSALAGCSGGESSAAPAAGSQSEATSAQTVFKGETPTGGLTKFSTQVEIQVPVYDRSITGLPPVDDNYWTKWIQKEFGDKYNVKVTYVAIPRKDEVTKMNMLISANDAPSIIFHYDYPQAVAYADQGALAEIDMDAFQKTAPTYYKNMKDSGILKYCKLNGKNMFVMGTRPVSYNWVTLIRQDWIDKVNMKMPTNYTEYKKLLDAWKKAGLCKYPLGNSLPTSGYVTNQLFRPWPTDEKDIALYADLTVASLPWDATYKQLKRWNSEYNAGYYSKEYYLDKDGTQQKTDFINGKIGVYGNYLTSDSDYIKGLMKNFPDAKLSVLPPEATLEDGQKPISRAYWPFGLILGFSSQNSADENKATMMLLEWMSQKDNLFTLQNGIEGKTYKLNSDDIPVPIDCKGDEQMNYNSNSDMYCLVTTGKEYGSEEKNVKGQIAMYAPKGFEYLIEDSYKYFKKTEPYQQTDYLFSKSIPSVAEYKATLLSKWQKDTVILTTCKPSEFDSKYKHLCKEYLDAGYQKILDERKAAYEADQKK
ncbi:MAG: extracellular solute-binding protein [Oscillospiraceae bacterium]|nr:extracellular solute-binding protein [Oscillospiraceae bacterium]